MIQKKKKSDMWHLPFFDVKYLNTAGQKGQIDQNW